MATAEDFRVGPAQASVSRDRGLIARLWNPGAQAFWPEGPEGSDVAVITAVPERAEFWDWLERAGRGGQDGVCARHRIDARSRRQRQGQPLAACGGSPHRDAVLGSVGRTLTRTVGVADCGAPVKRPATGLASPGVRVTATRINWRSPTSRLVGSNSIQPSPGT